MEEVFFRGGSGRIEGRMEFPTQKVVGAVLLLHPEPSKMGSMNNKLLIRASKIFKDEGFIALRFNFRGVGKSEGTVGNAEGDLADAADALHWLREQYQAIKLCTIFGFSYGAWLALHLLMRHPSLQYFFVVSPPVDEREFAFLNPCPTPGTVIQGTSDTVTSYLSVQEFVSELTRQRRDNSDYPIQLKLLKNGSHSLDNVPLDFSNAMTESINAFKNLKMKTNENN